MTVLCIKARPTFPTTTTFSGPFYSRLVECFPGSVEPIHCADLVLFDTACNRFTLATRDRLTGEMHWTSAEGNRNGREFCRLHGFLVK